MAGELAGVSMGEIEQATKKLTKRLSETAAGSGSAVGALQRPNLTAAELQALPLDERNVAIQEALNRFVPEAERAAVASDLFGDKAALAFLRIDAAKLREAATAQFSVLDRVALLAEIRLSQARLTKMADEGPQDQDADPKADVERFLDGLRHAWKEGEIRPTSQRKPPVVHNRTVPDPLEAVTSDLRCLFEQDPSRTGCEFLEEIQATYPGLYPVSVLRTVQRRVKTWRHEMAKSLVLGQSAPMSAADALRYEGTARATGTQTSASIG